MIDGWGCCYSSTYLARTHQSVYISIHSKHTHIVTNSTHHFKNKFYNTVTKSANFIAKAPTLDLILSQFTSTQLTSLRRSILITFCCLYTFPLRFSYQNIVCISVILDLIILTLQTVKAD